MNAAPMRRANDGWNARQLIAALGAAAAAVLAGFMAPMIEFGGQAPLATPSARLFTVALMLGLACVILLLQRALSARRNRALLDQLATASAEGDGAQRGRSEVAVLRRRFEQALAQLRVLRFGRGGRLAGLLGRHFVSELPWYVIIGAPGAGKTTVLLNAGLHFPLADASGPAGANGPSVRGVGGTRNCDWWFASEAVLIDTAGRYATQDSDSEADRTAWLGFLQLLRRYRARRPINGVLLAVSATELLNGASAAAHSHTLRARVDELRRHLGVEAPLYLLITKTDLLPGFSEFFADLDAGARQQVWGATLPLGATSAPWQHELMALDERLQARLLERLAQDGDATRRLAIHEFAQQWRALAAALRGVLEQVGRADGDGGAAPLLRGVYFTSAAQDGGNGSVSYFVTRLLREVVFAESELAGSAHAGASRRWWPAARRWLQRGALAATAAALLLAVGTSWHGYERQVRAVDAFAARVQPLETAVAAGRNSTEPSALLPALDALAAAAAGDFRDDGMAERLLDRREALAAAADDAWRRVLRDALLPRIAARLEERLRNSAGEAPARTYETLRAYLMLFGGKHFDADALREYLVNDWAMTLPDASTADRAALLRHLDRLLASGEVGAPSRADARLVAAARERVRSVPLAQRAAARLQQLDASAPRPALAGAGVLVRADGAEWSATLPPPIVAATALRPRVQRALAELAREEAWVLGSARAAATPPGLGEEVERVVIADAAQQWQALLDDVRLAPTHSLAQAAQLARALAHDGSPLTALLRAAARDAASGAGAQGPFAALRGWVDAAPVQPGAAAAPPSLARIKSLFSRVAVQLDQAAEAVQRGAVPPAGDALRELAQEARQAPQPLQRLLSQFHAAAAALLQTALRDPLSREVAREIGPACNRLLAQRYPFARDAIADVSRDDFARVFGSGGLFDAFAQRHGGTMAALGDDARGSGSAAWQRAQAVRESFFRDGGRALGTRLEWRLIELDAGAGEFTLDIDGQVLRFKRDGNKAPQAIDWLTLGGSGRVHVQLAPGSGSGYTFNGPWALLRLLDRARVERGGSADRVQVTFDIEGRKARFEVKAPAAPHPLLRSDLETFACPTRW